MTTANLQQLLAASALIVTCERLASSGLLDEQQEGELRILICRACRAFEIPTIAERAPEPREPQIFELVHRA
jgi:hypothetical protein